MAYSTGAYRIPSSVSSDGHFQKLQYALKKKLDSYNKGHFFNITPIDEICVGKNQMVIQGEGIHLSHPNSYVSVIEKVSKVSEFYTMYIMNSTLKYPTPYKPIPSIYKMLAIIIVRSGFQCGSSLGKNLGGIIELVLIIEKLFKYELGYMSSKKVERDIKKKSLESVKRLPLLFQSFPASIKAYINS